MHPYVPDFEQMFTPKGAEILRIDQGRKGLSIPNYLKSLVPGLAGDPSARVYGQVASCVDPDDSALGINQQRPLGLAFSVGHHPARLLVARFTSKEFQSTIHRSKLAPLSQEVESMRMLKDEDAKRQQRAAIADYVIEVADRGWARANGAYDEVFDSWSEAVFPQDFSQRLFMRRGFGFVLGCADIAHKNMLDDDIWEIDEKHARQQFGTLADWDAELVSLTADEVQRNTAPETPPEQ